jgi:uncharacterized membrane protein (GlpM family)
MTQVQKPGNYTEIIKTRSTTINELLPLCSTFRLFFQFIICTYISLFEFTRP